MKRGTIESPKVAELMMLLGITRSYAVGVLESLWHFTQRHAPRGDVGKWSNEAIAKAIDYPDAEKLISSLVGARWLDNSKEHRLLVHDWQEHADQTTRRFLASHLLAFASTKLAKCKHHTSKGEDETSSPEPEPVPAPVPKGTPQAAAVLPENLQTPDFQKAWRDWGEYLTSKRKPLKLMTADRQLAKLSNFGPVVGAAMIEQSIEKGWQGLFEIKSGSFPIPATPKREISMAELCDYGNPKPNNSTSAAVQHRK
jgi:hypothetical protein